MTTAVAVATMKAAQVTAAGAGLKIVELEVPDPGPGQVRIKVQACGVCHSDAIIVEGRRPGIGYPRVPGHEVAGLVDALGTGVTDWREGQRVGVGWHGGHDGTCPECRRGDFRLCRNEKNPGLSYDGGYAEYMLAPVEALVPIPYSLTDIDAAPLLCAGSNTFNALRSAGALPGDLVAVQGIGGLGHLGIQFASKFGYKVAPVLSRKSLKKASAVAFLLPRPIYPASPDRLIQASSRDRGDSYPAMCLRGLFHELQNQQWR